MAESFRNVAVMIDADNARIDLVKDVLEDAAKYGRIVVKEAFGDWSDGTLKGWPDKIRDLGIHPIQQFAYTKGKNATDIEMVIGTMDLLSAGRYDLFVIVSSDSDFTPLAIRLRESGAAVYGYGERKTPSPFIKSCDRFIFTEDLETRADPTSGGETAPSKKPDPRKTAAEAIVERLIRLSEDAREEDGWVSGAEAGQYLLKIDPSFNLRATGYRKFSDLINANGDVFEAKLEKQDAVPNPLFFFRAKQDKK